MPCMNGYELVKEIKTIDPKVKVILMSAVEFSSQELKHTSTKVSSEEDIAADSFITKQACING